MSIFNKIVTAVRGSVRELGETVMDANGTRTYEQEIIDARDALNQAKQDLTLVMAKEMQAGRDIDRLVGEIARYENHAAAALDKGEEKLAGEVADRIVALDSELMEQRKARTEFAASIERLKGLITQAETKLREHERELVMTKTAESVHRATQSISHSMGAGGSKLLSAKESLDRIKQRQRDLADQMTAAAALEGELGGQALERKLEAAGIGENAGRRDEVLARITARRDQSSRTAGSEVDDA
ncbi:PspA/IM30 family protein [Chitinimonas sp. PSY-7]|uniref:PspA/IM30 family protein n=1 Tax=Chitinimonas sp. PSY-7 TaxID=3459088 RepID=UPI00403FD4C8